MQKTSGHSLVVINDKMAQGKTAKEIFLEMKEAKHKVSIVTIRRVMAKSRKDIIVMANDEIQKLKDKGIYEEVNIEVFLNEVIKSAYKSVKKATLAEGLAATKLMLQKKFFLGDDIANSIVKGLGEMIEGPKDGEIRP